MFAKEIIYDNIRIVVIFFVHLFLGQLTEQAIKLGYMYGILYVSYMYSILSKRIYVIKKASIRINAA